MKTSPTLSIAVRGRELDRGSKVVVLVIIVGFIVILFGGFPWSIASLVALGCWISASENERFSSSILGRVVSKILVNWSIALAIVALVQTYLRTYGATNDEVTGMVRIIIASHEFFKGVNGLEVCVVLYVLGIALFLSFEYPNAKMASRVLGLRNWTGKVAAVLVVISTFSFAASYPVGTEYKDISEKLSSRHWRAVLTTAKMKAETIRLKAIKGAFGHISEAEKHSMVQNIEAIAAHADLQPSWTQTSIASSWLLTIVKVSETGPEIIDRNIASLPNSPSSLKHKIQSAESDIKTSAAELDEAKKIVNAIVEELVGLASEPVKDLVKTWIEAFVGHLGKHADVRIVGEVNKIGAKTFNGYSAKLEKKFIDLITTDFTEMLKSGRLAGDPVSTSADFFALLKNRRLMAARDALTKAQGAALQGKSARFDLCRGVESILLAEKLVEGKIDGKSETLLTQLHDKAWYHSPNTWEQMQQSILEISKNATIEPTLYAQAIFVLDTTRRFPPDPATEPEAIAEKARERAAAQNEKDRVLMKRYMEKIRAVSGGRGRR